VPATPPQSTVQPPNIPKVKVYIVDTDLFITR
jgi:hypothetical protein